MSPARATWVRASTASNGRSAGVPPPRRALIAGAPIVRWIRAEGLPRDYRPRGRRRLKSSTGVSPRGRVVAGYNDRPDPRVARRPGLDLLLDQVDHRVERLLGCLETLDAAAHQGE